MAIVYKLDILDALKSKGYNTNRLRKEKLLSESVIQGLRDNRYITLPNISTICALLEEYSHLLLLPMRESDRLLCIHKTT